MATQSELQHIKQILEAHVTELRSITDALGQISKTQANSFAQYRAHTDEVKALIVSESTRVQQAVGTEAKTIYERARHDQLNRLTLSTATKAIIIVHHDVFLLILVGLGLGLIPFASVEKFFLAWATGIGATIIYGVKLYVSYKQGQQGRGRRRDDVFLNEEQPDTGQRRRAED